MDIRELIRIARNEQPADLLLKNARLVNVLSGEIYLTDIVVAGEQVAALGNGYQAKETIDLEGRYVSPGLIDAHVHIESSMVPPREFARAVLPHGVTTIISDPHEIANVLGLEGIRFMLQDAKYGPLSMFVDAPSCVPATNMETSGSQLEFYDLATLLSNEWVIGLGEVMNYPGIIHGDPQMLQKIRVFHGKIIDGHAPGVSGYDLNAYIAAGIGSDHECTTIEEAMAKLRLGMTIFVREATNAHNLEPLLGLFKPEYASRLCLCTDDRHPSDLIEEGSIDYMIRYAVSHGVPPVLAIRAGTLNPAEYFHLLDRGAIAPGKRADLVVFSDLQNFYPEQVYRGGKLAAQNGQMLSWDQPQNHTKARGTINVKVDALNFKIPATGTKIHVIGMVPNQLITENRIEDACILDGYAVADPDRELTKIAVVERHFGTGRIGLGFVQGMGLKAGAIACSVAHDHHNIVVAGMDDQSMFLAVSEIIKMQGGMVVVGNQVIRARLPLPIAGLMSDMPLSIVCEQYNKLAVAAAELGSPLHDPFMALSFLGLSVIPSLKITDLGLVDVDKFEVVDLFVT
jgi:adenine deaminase